MAVVTKEDDVGEKLMANSFVGEVMKVERALVNDSAGFSGELLSVFDEAKMNGWHVVATVRARDTFGAAALAHRTASSLASCPLKTPPVIRLASTAALLNAGAKCCVVERHQGQTLRIKT